MRVGFQKSLKMGKREEEKKPRRGNAWKHGHRYSANGKPSRTYRCWVSMMKRLVFESDKHPYYKKVYLHEPWKKFENFLEDVGEAPSEKHTIDRINPTLGYRPGNVRWSTMREQARNKSSNIWVEGKILKDWCQDKGFKYKTVHSWYKKGLHWDEIKVKGEQLWGSDLHTKT